MPESLFAARRFRRSYLACCALAAITLEGSVVGIAQIWPQDKTVSTAIPTTIIDDLYPDDVQVVIYPVDTPLPTTDQPTPPPEPEPMPEADTPPPSDEPEMLLDTPKPKPSPSRTKPLRPTAPTGPIPPNARRGDRPQVGVASGVPSAARTSGPLPLKAGGGWRVSSKPPYPAQARTFRVTGSGTIRLTTDASGKVVNVAISQSSGSGVLDGAVTSYAKLNWSGPSNATITVPFTFRLP